MVIFMIKLATIMAFAFLLSPCLKASDEQESRCVGRMPYTKKGTIFENHTYKLIKEVFEGENARITHKPESKILCLASIEHLDPNVILHNNYFQKNSAEESIKSFIVTPNPHGLSADTPNKDLLSHMVYAKIPVRLSASASRIDLLMFDEPGAFASDDYARTIAHGLKFILCSYLPSAYSNGTLPSFDTLTIQDSSELLANALRKKDSPVAVAISEHYTFVDFSREDTNPYWKLSYKFKPADQK